MLIKNWYDVLLKAWSVRLIVLAGVIELAQNVLPFVSDFLPWWASVAITVAAFGSRFIDQGLAKQ